MFVLPAIAASEPAFVNEMLAVATNRAPASDIGPLQILIHGGGFAYGASGLLFGIAPFRARVLARWAECCSSVAILAASQLPEPAQRLLAIPVSVALVGLGHSLWRDRRLTRPGVSDHRPCSTTNPNTELSSPGRSSADQPTAAVVSRRAAVGADRARVK